MKLLQIEQLQEKAADEDRITQQEARDLLAEVLRLREALAGLVSDFDALIAGTEGVYGLHLNGAPAPWNELTQGGAFEQWTAGLEPARAALNGDAP